LEKVKGGGSMEKERDRREQDKWTGHDHNTKAKKNGGGCKKRGEKDHEKEINITKTLVAD